MYDAKKLTPEVIDWAFAYATNELNAYLCEVDFHQMYGPKWAKLARATASQCRVIAEAATDRPSRDSWLALARDYEDTIESEQTSAA